MPRAASTSAAPHKNDRVRTCALPKLSLEMGSHCKRYENFTNNVELPGEHGTLSCGIKYLPSPSKLFHKLYVPKKEWIGNKPSSIPYIELELNIGYMLDRSKAIAEKLPT